MGRESRESEGYRELANLGRTTRQITHHNHHKYVSALNCPTNGPSLARRQLMTPRFFVARHLLTQIAWIYLAIDCETIDSL